MVAEWCGTTEGSYGTTPRSYDRTQVNYRTPPDAFAKCADVVR
jgi:hypothetical protein